MTPQLALRLDAPDPRAYVRVLDAVESLARVRRGEVQARGGVWAPSDWITHGDDVAETERGRFNVCVLDAMDRVGFPRISPADLRDATRDIPLWSEAWQRFVEVSELRGDAPTREGTPRRRRLKAPLVGCTHSLVGCARHAAR